jgi:hypothetical protein
MGVRATNLLNQHQDSQIAQSQYMHFVIVTQPHTIHGQLFGSEFILIGPSAVLKHKHGHQQ